MAFNGSMTIILFLCLVTRTPISSADSLNNSVFYGDAVNCDVGAEYPFGLQLYLPGFQIYCDALQNTSAKIMLGGANITLLKVSREEGYIRALMDPTMWRCGRTRGLTGSQAQAQAPGQNGLSLEGTPFTYSQERNKFTVIGCDALVVLNNSTANETYGCVSSCPRRESIPDENCMGEGCCQSSIPPGLKSFDLEFYSINNLTHSGIGGVSECTRSLVVETEAFQFRAIYAEDDGNSPSSWPVVLDWSIGTQTCAKAKLKSDYVCNENSDCYDPPSGIGYRCNCSGGYVGNPYLLNGCQDIDECKLPNNCIHTCVNKKGTYECRCLPGFRGDGKREGTGCEKSPDLYIYLIAGLVLLVMILIIAALVSWSSKNRKKLKIRQKCFMKNGGMLLQQSISSRRPGPKIFTIDEIMRATNGFHNDRVIGKGGYGTVYKGIFPNGEIVAIKKAKLVDETQIDQFINELVILSQINHKNVVKLLGSCLEDHVPLLVYEFIPNGTLFHHIHENRTSNLSWIKRLNIATETAGAIAYLHYKASIPIIHRDIKSANILLDNDCNAKVSDFGASRLIGFNQTHITTVVQGTLGYLDPEYFHTSQLTEKSDVYSFGVVLMEILTGEMPISFWKCEMGNLASHFATSLEERCFLDMVDRKLVSQVDKFYLFAIADIARRCVIVKGEERPTMREVAVELDALRRLSKKHFKLETLSEEEISSAKPLNICRENLNREISPEISLLFSSDIQEER